MHLREKRIIGGIVFAFLIVGVFYGELYLTPSGFFASPVYWFGLGVYSIAGWLFVTKPSRTWKYFGMGVMVTGFALAAASQRYPILLTFAFGFLGLFVGMSLRLVILLLFQKR